MGVIKFGVEDAVGAVAEGGNFYDGPVPPTGPYRAVLKRLELKKSGPGSKKPGTPMLSYLVEIAEPPKSKKNKYNGYGIWGNQMITDQGKGYLNQMLNSIAGSEASGLKLQKLFWEKGILTDGDGLGHVKKIGGTFRVNSPDCEFKVIISTKNKRTTKQYPDPGLEVSAWLVPTSDAAEDLAEGDDEDFEGDVADDDDDIAMDGDVDIDDSDVDGDDDDMDFGDDDDAKSEGSDDSDDDDLSDDDDSLDDDDDLDDDEGGDDSDAEDLDAEEDPKVVALRAELAEITDLKAIRLFARDKHDIPANDTKGKTVDEVKEMIVATISDEPPF